MIFKRSQILIASFTFIYLTACSEQKPVTRDFPTMRVINASLVAEQQSKSAAESYKRVLQDQEESHRAINEANSLSAQAQSQASTIESKAKIMGVGKPAPSAPAKSH